MSLRSDIMIFSVLGFKSDIKIELPAPVVTDSILNRFFEKNNFGKKSGDHSKNLNYYPTYNELREILHIHVGDNNHFVTCPVR